MIFGSKIFRVSNVLCLVTLVLKVFRTIEDLQVYDFEFYCNLLQTNEKT